MNIAVSHMGNLDLERSQWIEAISETLQSHIDDLDFGNSLKALTIAIVCVKPEFDFFFKERKPKYYSGSKKITHDGFTFEVHNLLEYDIKLDFAKFSTLGKVEFQKEISIAIICSLDKINDFKLDDFKLDDFKININNALKLHC
jgi:hypothetical protein